ncbi:hypothetical protein HYS93_04160 [Candidatus Daviesbacteria bacterium]|nr:hypothetical protein [Candidatus Daviesbacteria bacterium]
MVFSFSVKGSLTLLIFILVVFLTFVFLGLTYRQTIYAATDSQQTEIAREDKGPSKPKGELLLAGLELFSFIFLVAALILTVYNIGNIGPGVLNVVFISFFFGVLFLGLTRVFIFLTDQGFYQITDETLHLWWHVIFYLGMISFIWGGYRLKQISTAEHPSGFNNSDKIFFGLLSLAVVGIFLVANPFESTLAKILEESVIASLGLHHFLAFILASVAAWYIYYIKNNWGNLLSVGAVPILVFLSLMGLQHFWELVTESWKLISIPESTIEQVEQLIIIPAYLLLIFAMLKTAKIIQGQTKAANANSTNNAA